MSLLSRLFGGSRVKSDSLIVRRAERKKKELRFSNEITPEKMFAGFIYGLSSFVKLIQHVELNRPRSFLSVNRKVIGLLQRKFPNQERIILKSGREILIHEIYIYYTFIGILVGDPVECSANIRSKLRSSILDKFPWFRPLYIFDEGLTVLPAYTCVADVWSPAPMNPENHASFLHICWFTNDIARPIPPMIKEILDGIVWEAWAEDGCF
jgi:hypothetical protein